MNRWQDELEGFCFKYLQNFKLLSMPKDSGDSEGFQNPGSSEDLWKSERGKKVQKRTKSWAGFIPLKIPGFACDPPQMEIMVTERAERERVSECRSGVRLQIHSKAFRFQALS